MGAYRSEKMPNHMFPTQKRFGFGVVTSNRVTFHTFLRSMWHFLQLIKAQMSDITMSQMAMELYPEHPRDLWDQISPF